MLPLTIDLTAPDDVELGYLSQLYQWRYANYATGSTFNCNKVRDAMSMNPINPTQLSRFTEMW